MEMEKNTKSGNVYMQKEMEMESTLNLEINVCRGQKKLKRMQFEMKFIDVYRCLQMYRYFSRI